jgi:hypothetical protein
MSKKPKKQSNSNIILFPPSRVVNPTRSALRSEDVPKSIEHINNATSLLKIKRIDQIMEEMLPVIAQGFLTKGVVLNKQNEMKPCAFMIETIRSVVCMHFGIRHPFHELAENIFHQDNATGIITVKEIAVKDMSANSVGANT